MPPPGSPTCWLDATWPLEIFDSLARHLEVPVAHRSEGKLGLRQCGAGVHGGSQMENPIVLLGWSSPLVSYLKYLGASPYHF